MRRNQSIELLRIISAFGIVWFHAGLAGHSIAYAGLAVFLTLSTYFGIISTSGPERALRERTVRILGPWVFWFLVYAALKLISGRPVFPVGYNFVSDILAGPQIHLWYLPFFFCTSCILDIEKITIRPKILLYYCFFATGFILFSSPLWVSWNLAAPIPQYINAMTPVLIGVILGIRNDLWSRNFFLLVLAAIMLLLFITNISKVGEPYLIGMIAVIFAIEAGERLGIFSNRFDVFWLSECMFGVYLVHPIFLSLLKMRLNGPIWVVGVFLLSAAFSWLVLHGAPPLLAKIMFGRAARKRDRTIKFVPLTENNNKGNASD